MVFDDDISNQPSEKGSREARFGRIWVDRNQIEIDVKYKIVVRVLLDCFLLYLPAFLVFAAFFLSFLSWAALRCSGFIVA
jgi:hypothetical protein